MEKLTVEQLQIRREALQSLEDNQMFQQLRTKLQARRNSKRQEQREAAFNNDSAKSFGCEWALWGLEQTDIILEQLRSELKDRPEKVMKY